MSPTGGLRKAWDIEFRRKIQEILKENPELSVSAISRRLDCAMSALVLEFKITPRDGYNAEQAQINRENRIKNSRINRKTLKKPTLLQRIEAIEMQLEIIMDLLKK